jgi:glycosyl transferase family 4
MDVLILAPYPFYQDRGSPIALDMILRVLSARGEKVDVIVYHEGRDIKYDGVTMHRCAKLPFVNDIRPGFSWKKVLCDILMFLKTVKLVIRGHYNLIHAVEESVYIAVLMKWIFKIPYVYDMDSSLAQQMIERYAFLNLLKDVLNFFEKLAVRHAMAVVPVCDALAELIQPHHPQKVVILRDVSLLKEEI